MLIEQTKLQVLNERSEAVKVQLSPVFVTPHLISFQEYEVSFVISVPPLGMVTYLIRRFDGSIPDNA